MRAFNPWHLLAATLLTAASSPGQVVDHNLNGWGMYFGDHPIGQSRWGAHLEGQWRRHDGFNRWQQLLLRPGINFEVNKKLLLTGGYAFINSYPYGDFPTLAKAHAGAPALGTGPAAIQDP